VAISLLECANLITKGSAPRDSNPSELREKILSLSRKLTETDPLSRPRYLTDALWTFRIIDEQSYREAQKTLLSMCLLSGFLNISRRPAQENQLGKILEHSRVFGLRDELVADFVNAYRLNRIETFRVFRRLLVGAAVEKHSDFWHVSFEDDALRIAYRRLEQIVEHPKSKRSRAEVESHRSSKHLERSFLYLKEEYEQLPATTSEAASADRESLVAELVELARRLNLHSDAIEYGERLLELREASGEVDLKLVRELTTDCLCANHTKRAGELIAHGLKHSQDLENVRYELTFRGLEAWFAGIGGQYEQAESSLESVLESALENSLMDVAALVNYNLATLRWRQGELSRALDYLKRALTITDAHKLTSESVTILIGLSLLYYELGDYQQSVTSGKRAVKTASQPRDLAKLPSVFSSLAVVHCRLGKHRMAEYWLQRFIASKSVSLDRDKAVEFFLNSGFLKANAGELQSARELWLQALELCESSLSRRNLGKIHHNLAMNAVYRGDSIACERYVDKAISIFEELGDSASCAEVNLISRLNDLYNKRRLPSNLIPAELETLPQHACPYYLALGLFHRLVNSVDNGDSAKIASIGYLRDLVDKSQAPVLRAVSALWRLADDPPEDHLAIIRVFKDVYRLLENSGQRFLALITCRRIAELYSHASKGKLARKFLTRALSMARDMGNDVFVSDIEHQLESTISTGVDAMRITEALHGISEVLKGMNDYESSLRRLVQFAVDETGAERGVLLLKRERSKDLQTVAIVNCDEGGLSDIREISSSVPHEVQADPKPLIVDNAIADIRTNRFKSIIQLNILSVMCIPIIRDQRFLGVLYLDHHTIPTLFEKQDTAFANSVANFIAVALEALQDHKNVRTINRQLVQDLNRFTGSDTFVTEDPTMVQMLSRFPEIARTDTPVLIMGATGTGKEILCHMIHDLSLRSGKPFVILNCSAIAGSLAESELFGVARNAATGVREREGKFGAADGGTLLMDEIGEMHMDIQAKVLRAVENQRFELVGSNRTIYTDIRFLYATNKDLRKLIKRGKFREDLYYRINTITIDIPPLVERRGDIPLLIEHFTMTYSIPGNAPRLSPEAIEALVAYEWPGNVRELRNLIERLCILHAGRSVDVTMLPDEIQSCAMDQDRGGQLALAVEKAQLLKALNSNRWNQTQAARSLGMPLSTFRRKIKKYTFQKTL